MKKIIMIFLLLFATAFPAIAEVQTGQTAPDFTLKDTHGKTHHLSDYKDKFVVLEWLNPECPFVKKHYESQNMQGLQKDYTGKGVIWLTISSAAQGKQGSYSVSEFNDWAKANNFTANALLLDTDGKVGKMYAAKTTPHMYIVDPKGSLIYQGAIDSIATPDKNDIAKAQNYVRSALDEAMAGKPVTVAATKAYGCSVKY